MEGFFYPSCDKDMSRRKGSELSYEHRRKISEAVIKQLSNGRTPNRLGIPHTEETKKKISQANKK